MNERRDFEVEHRKGGRLTHRSLGNEYRGSQKPAKGPKKERKRTHQDELEERIGRQIVLSNGSHQVEGKLVSCDAFTLTLEIHDALAANFTFRETFFKSALTSFTFREA